MIFRWLNGVAIYCLHRGWATRLRRIWGTRWWYKKCITHLRASYRHNTITMALPLLPLNDIYAYSLRVYFIGQYPPSIHPKHTYYHNKISRLAPTRTIICYTSTTFPPIKWLPMTEIIIYTRYVQYSWLGYVSGTAGIVMKMGDIFWFGTHITINLLAWRWGELQIQQYTIIHSKAMYARHMSYLQNMSASV